MVSNRGPHHSAAVEMKMTAIKTMKKPIAILSVLIIAALTMGVAVAERMELRANQDVFSLGNEPASVAE